MSKIDVSRVKKTKGGHPVRIYAKDGAGEYPIHGAILFNDGWRDKTWNVDGRYYNDNQHSHDLVEEPETVEIDVWLNVRENGSSVWWESRDQADRNASRDRFACINIKRTITKGEGLE